MLSTENPPPDPPCRCETSQLKSSSSDERASDIKQLQLEVDLFKSGLDDNNPLPKFSIRDYVFSTRGKDIKTNWPFSPKKLQLCLKHGVSDVLPPFQSLDFVRNQSVVKCVNHNTSNSDEIFSPFRDHLVSVSSDNVGRQLVVDIENINSSGSDENKAFPSTTSQSYSDKKTVSPLRSIYLVPEAQNLPGKSEEKIKSAVQASNKVESSIQNPVKKCRLIVKLSNIAVPTANEDSAVNTSVVSERMASKVCPVCKTFSSSSNTTLNAHIDQCLSGESTIKWATNSKVIKHRIKPRKTRLMMDIYTTALHCTLEDLDRRNGTNWASSLGFRAQDFETCAELKNETYSSVNIGDKNEEGAVYIDSNGTKHRILSKFNDLPSSSNVKGDCGPRNLLKKDKGSKYLACKKKNNLVQKLKLLKCSYGQRSCFAKTNHCFEDYDGQLRKFTPEEGCEKEDVTQPLKTYEQMKFNDLGMIKQWVSSKRSVLKKKFNLEHENWYPDKIMKNLGVKSSLSSSNDKMKRTRDLNSSVISNEDLLLPTQGSRIKKNLSFNSHDECKEPLSLKKRVGFSLLESRDCHDKRNHMVLTKCNIKLLRKDGPSVHELYMDPSNSTENHISAQSNKRMELNISPDKNVDVDRFVITPRLSQHHALSSGGKKCSYQRKSSLNHELSSRGKFSSLRKKLFSPRHAFVPASKKNLGRTHLELKKRRLHYTSESDEGAQVLQSAICRQDNLVVKLGENAAQMEEASVKSYINRTRVLKIQKMREEFVNSGKGGAMASKGPATSSESDCPGKNFDSFMSGNVPPVTSSVLDAVQEAEIPEEFVYEQNSKIAGGAFMGFNKSLGSAFPALTGPGVECISQHCIKALEEHCPAERILGGEQNMFYADKFGKGMVIHNADAVTEMDTNEGNYFVDVDPIPIPGPPGSFLPSPGHMGSEDLQGNSSLTTCRIQSSEEEDELVDMDSSDSPVSVTSMVSISNAAKIDTVSFELQSNGVQHETGLDKSGAKIDHSVESSTPFGEGNLEFDESRANVTFPEMSSSRFKNSQPCCCSRKEGVSSSVSLNSQESLLLRRSESTLPLLAPEKEMGGDPKKKLNSFNLRSETLPVNEPSPESEKSIVNSPMGYAPILVSHNSEATFPTCGDCESPSPSTSNPVLRLMGKNLLVVNKDEDLSPQTRIIQSSMTNDYPDVQSCINNSGSIDKIQNEDCSFHHMLSQGSSTFDHMQSSKLAQHFYFSSSNGFKIPGNLRTPCLPSHPSKVVLPSKNFGRSLTSSLERREYVGGCNLTPEQLDPKIRLNTSITYDTDQKVQTSAPQLRIADFSSSNYKEIIIIDDSHESVAGLAVEATPGELNMEARGSMVGISAAVVLGYDSRHVNPFYSYQRRGHGRFRVVPNANILEPTFKGMNANPAKWNCPSEGSSALHSNSLTASSPSTGHRGSPLYFLPSF